MIDDILPAEVVSAEAFDDTGDAELFPEEEALVARAVERRRLQFATARACARRALAELGFPPAPILQGERGAPRWPAGVVGSITHCDGYRASAVARASDVLTIGIDAEPNGELPEGVLARVALAEEQVQLRQLAAADPSVRWDRLLFSAKESVYKAWFPLTRRWLGFEDAAVDLDPGGTFHARFLVRGPTAGGAPVTGFDGRWTADRGLVVSAIAVPAARGDT